MTLASMSPAAFRLHVVKVRIAKVRAAEHRTVEVFLSEVRPAEVRVPQIHRAKVLENNSRHPGKVWTDVRVLIAPRIPAGRSMEKLKHVIEVCHVSSPQLDSGAPNSAAPYWEA